MYNLIEYSDNYSKTSESLWQYYRDDLNDNITQSESFKFKIKITEKIPAAGNTKHAEIVVPLKYLSNFCRTLEMPLINYEINHISSTTGATKFEIADAKLYIPVVILSTQDNAKLLQQFKSGFKRTITWNKYQSKVLPEMQNKYWSKFSRTK